MMKDTLNKTKVVLRQLPPSISQSDLMDQINGRFYGRYKWFSFHAGKNSQKNMHHSRAYIDFHRPEDVVEFAEFFDGHMFVNEKGNQFKSTVEYAPSQRVPDSSKKDGREGTILKDPDYMEFFQFILKPVENLPSAEIQLERRETAKAGGLKEAVIVTPLMDFIRKKRAAKSGSRRSSGKITRRGGGAMRISSSSSKQSVDKGRGPTSVFVLKDSAKSSSSGNNKSTYTLMTRKEEKQLGKAGITEDGIGSNGALPTSSESENKIVILNGKEREVSQVSGVSLIKKNTTAAVRNITPINSSKQSQRHDASGVIRTILSNKNRRPPRCPTVKDNFANTDGLQSLDYKNNRRMRNRDRPDRNVWAPLSSDGSYVTNDISLHVERNGHKDEENGVGVQIAPGGRGNNSSADNGSYKHVGRRGSANYMKEMDGSLNFSDGKLPKGGVSVGYGSYDRQVWVQKLGSGS